MNRETYLHMKSEMQANAKRLMDCVNQLGTRDVDQVHAIADIMSEINYFASKLAASADVCELVFRPSK